MGFSKHQVFLFSDCHAFGIVWQLVVVYSNESQQLSAEDFVKTAVVIYYLLEAENSAVGEIS